MYFIHTVMFHVKHYTVWIFYCIYYSHNVFFTMGLVQKSTYISGFILSSFYLYIIINIETIYSVKQSNVSCETLKIINLF